MKVVALSAVAPARRFLALGFFDGVHLGHQQVLAEAVRLARESGSVAAAFTFRQHPRHVLSGVEEPKLLTTFEERVELLAEHVDEVIWCDFTPEVAQVEPEAFVQEWLLARLGAQGVTSGDNFRFGHRARGTPQAITEVPARVVAPVQWQGERISSSRIRAAVAQGDMRSAQAMLSRPYFVTAPVARGEGRGATLGAPTANLAIDAIKQAPQTGVYAVWVKRDRQRLAGVANFGVRPTFGGGPVQLEVHLLDRQESLYDETLRVEFVERLRDERRFPNSDALMAQIRVDVEQARACLT
ncbi:MAG: riboflavin biosynthesis protein RibF [Candidatus Xenobia bacterium]